MNKEDLDKLIELLEQVVKDHDRATCKCDCCILCYSEAMKEKELK